MARTPEQAMTWAQERVGDSGWDNLCLSFVRQSYGIDYNPASSWPTSERQAGRAWDRAQHKHPTTDPNAIPRGAPVFWELATEADHVALSLGDGWCLSNDFVVDGRIDRVRIADISARWGRLLGWTEDLVGNRVLPTLNQGDDMRVDGVDISHHQGDRIDYAAAKRAGVKWMYHKATEGATFTDKNYRKRRRQARRAGIPFGAYHFARASVGDAAAEAQAFLDFAKPKPGDLRPALDLETTEGLSLAQLRTWARTWIDVVTEATGVKPLVYTPFDLGEAVDGCVIWRPRYNDDNRPPELPWDIWQFSNGDLGRPDQVAGFGHVDLNTMRKGLTLDEIRIPKRQKPRKRWVGKLVAEYYNVGDGSDDAKKRDLTRFAAKGAHLILLAECGDRVQMLLQWAKAHGFHYWPGDGSPGAASVPALVRLDLLPAVALLSTSPATPPTHIGDAGAGPETAKAKVVQKIRIRRRWRTGIPRRPVRIAWSHFIPSATRGGLPNHDVREQLHQQHTKAMLDATGHGIALTLVVADFNAEWDHRLMDPYRAAGFEALPTGPTHERRTIDIWLVKVGRGRRALRRIRRLGLRAFTVRGSSDHHAIVVEIP